MLRYARAAWWGLLFGAQLAEAQPLGTWSEPGLTPLMAAAADGSVAAVDLLIEASPELIDAIDSTGFTALHYAVEENQIEVVRRLLLGGADPNPKTNSGWTPLMAASGEGRDDLVGVLIEHGADLEAGNGYRWTAVHYAAFEGRHTTLKLLLERGASPNPRSINGLTPLMTAARKGDSESAEILLEHGADPRLKADYGKTAADLAADQGNEELAEMIRTAPPPPAKRRLEIGWERCSNRYCWSCQFLIQRRCWNPGRKCLP